MATGRLSLQILQVLLPEQGCQPLVSGPAHGQLLAVAQYRDTAVLTVWLHLDHALQVDDIGAVDAYELAGVEARLQTRDGLLVEVRLAPRSQHYVVVLRF